MLLAGEALIVWTSFLLGTVLQHPYDSYTLLNYEGGYLKIAVVTVIVLVFSHWFDLYDPAQFNEKGELYFRLLLVPGFLALVLALIDLIFPRFMPGEHSALVGLIILTIGVVRLAHRLFVADTTVLSPRASICSGTDERAQRLVQGSADAL